MLNLFLTFITVFSIIIQPTPAPVVNAVLFYTPGCSYCQAVIASILPPLQARYGERLSIVEVPLNGIEDVDTLFASADFFGLKKEDVAVPFLVVGSQVLVGQEAIQAKFPGIIEQGLAQGGIPAPRLPAALAALEARPTSTLKGADATPLPPGVELGPVVPGAQAATSLPPGNCSESQTGSCAPAEAAATQPAPGPSPLLWAGAALAGVLVIGGAAWLFFSRRSESEEDGDEN